MTLLELANLVCAEVNHTETEDVAFAKTSLEFWNKAIWQRELWRDSLVSVDIPADVSDTGLLGASGYLAGKGTLLLPTGIEYPVAIRMTSGCLTPTNVEFYFRVDVDQFAASGRVTEFHLLSRCVAELKESDSIVAVHVTGGADDARSVVVDYLLSTNNRVSRATTVLGASTPTAIAATERIDSFTKPVTDAAVSLQTSDGQTIYQLTETETTAEKRARVRIIQTPATDTIFKILGKRPCPEFSGDNDLPSVNSSEQVLKTLCQASMLRRDRHYAKADQLFAEAGQHYDDLKKVEVAQQSHRAVLVPDSGYGEGFGVYGYPPLTW